MTRWAQCRLHQKQPDGCTKVIVGYIPERGAKVGARIEVKDEDGLWDVISVGEPFVEGRDFHAQQLRVRKTPPSLRSTS